MADAFGISPAKTAIGQPVDLFDDSRCSSGSSDRAGYRDHIYVPIYPTSHWAANVDDHGIRLLLRPHHWSYIALKWQLNSSKHSLVCWQPETYRE